MQNKPLIAENIFFSMKNEITTVPLPRPDLVTEDI